MTQRTTGFMAPFSLPAVYRAAQTAVGAARVRRELVTSYLRPRTGDTLLDIGCGTGDVLTELPDVTYVGFDLSADYVAAASQRFGSRGRFFTGSVDTVEAGELGHFDLVLAVGVLHHLDDAQALRTLSLARGVLRHGGRLVTIDPVLSRDQSRIARFLVSQDRGRNVRTPDRYRDLAQTVFPWVETHERHDLLRVPYSHAILDCLAA